MNGVLLNRAPEGSSPPILSTILTAAQVRVVNLTLKESKPVLERQLRQ